MLFEKSAFIGMIAKTLNKCRRSSPLEATMNTNPVFGKTIRASSVYLLSVHGPHAHIVHPQTIADHTYGLPVQFAQIGHSGRPEQDRGRNSTYLQSSLRPKQYTMSYYKAKVLETDLWLNGRYIVTLGRVMYFRIVHYL